MTVAAAASVFVRFHDGHCRVDQIHGETQREAEAEAKSHARALCERSDIENAFLLAPDEVDAAEALRRWR